MPDQVVRPVRNEGGVPPVLAAGRYLGEASGPLTMGYGCRPDSVRLPQGSPCGGVRLEDRHPDTKEEQKLPRHQIGQGPLEDDYTELPPRSGDSVPSNIIRLLQGQSHRDCLPEIQSAPTAYGYEGGGTVRYLLIST